MIQCIIIEDEPMAVQNLRRALMEHGDIRIAAVFEHASEGLLYASENDIDLIFLDVHLGRQNGLQELKISKKTPPVIVISANSQYALQGFELDVCDYLLKPFTTERLHRALEKFKATQHQTNEAPACFIIKCDSRFESIAYRDLICIEGMGDYRRVITLQRKIMTLQTFRELEEKLDPHYVMRIHKSYMIHLNALMEFKSSRVTLTNNMQLPVSETYRKALKERLQSGSFIISNKDAS